MAEAPSRPIVWQLSGEEEEIEGGMVFLGMKNCERTGGLGGGVNWEERTVNSLLQNLFLR